MWQAIGWRDPFEVFESLAGSQGLVFLDSARPDRACGRYSFIALEPFEVVTVAADSYDPFGQLQQRLDCFPLTPVKGLPPFQGGAAGFFSYELNRYLEKLPRAEEDDCHFPDLAVGLYDLVMAFDVLAKEAWIFSSGFPETNPFAREKRARLRMEALQARLAGCEYPSPEIFCPVDRVRGHFTREQYETLVRQVKEYIMAGDIFQANVSRRFHANMPEGLTPQALYRRLRKRNPAPFSAFVNLAGTCLVSASPERFIKLAEGAIETRPIKGTRPRGKTPAEDARLARELQISEKDIAENTMIVDLLRNDLSRVCHRVTVPQWCALETHPTVHHLVSVITGQLRAGLQPADVLRAVFPGGSVTGAPKIRAMEIIASLEPVVRGPYCGSIGYIGFDGSMDTSITIRTFAIRNGYVTFQAGGAIVLDSDPAAEFDETCDKARALFEVLTGQALA